jgi:hypothetical protein
MRVPGRTKKGGEMGTGANQCLPPAMSHRVLAWLDYSTSFAPVPNFLRYRHRLASGAGRQGPKRGEVHVVRDQADRCVCVEKVAAVGMR